MEIRQTNVVKYPEKYVSIVVDEKALEKIQSVCKSVKEPLIPFADVFLSLASLAAGAFISAVISCVPFELGWKAITFYILFPMIATGCLVAFFLLRKGEQFTAKNVADRVLEYLPELDPPKEKGDYNEP